ncbi:MAG: WXG100 family type VII secretion target [Ardenticatenaceae bacterium]|nr:WXG100 family type VII secretion target [Anaerolineales bacterium]MCB8984527.1 WXG100 family type VII secretion target [Ardenticatenaceae bacterium]MCB8986174.1 WXG100 family type VII secretion target [Ardenticatenaceae bacterium]
MSLKKLILRVARSVLNEVLGQINQQMSILQDSVRAPIQAMISQVTSGIWVGKGADAFVNECTNLFIPGSDRLIEHCSTLTTSINRAADVMEQADRQARGLVDNLAGVFQNIY